jgi:phosphopantothenoylcysteine decarboxylase / phosphopantothenate---cysteine ligase
MAQHPPAIAAAPVPRALITAGPTHEPIDAVRYIGNRSSGRMGLALAHAALARRWSVTLLLGPVALDPPQHSRLSVHRFQSAVDLQRLLHVHWPQHDLLLMAAAVADYTVKAVRGQPITDSHQSKIKRSGGGLTLELEPTPDLLLSLEPARRPGQIIVGFALESAGDLAREAARKLQVKRLDAIVANPLETISSRDITATLLWRDGRSVAAPPSTPKERFAEWLLDQVQPALAGPPAGD